MMKLPSSDSSEATIVPQRGLGNSLHDCSVNSRNCMLQIREAGSQAKDTAGELASQGRDVGETADKELKQAGDQAADQVTSGQTFVLILSPMVLQAIIPSDWLVEVCSRKCAVLATCSCSRLEHQTR